MFGVFESIDILPIALRSIAKLKPGPQVLRPAAQVKAFPGNV